MKLDFEKIKIEVESWLRAVGEIQLQSFRQLEKHQVDYKSSPRDLVTVIDKASEDFLWQKIHSTYPDHALLSEECGLKGSSNAAYRWVLDPLDGTSNYAQGLPVFCISLSLTDTQHQQTLFGAVYAPYLNEYYQAVKGQGAYRNGKRIEVSKKTTLLASVLGTGFPYQFTSLEDKQRIHAVFQKLQGEARGIRRMGAAAYDLCAVAASNLDAFWEFHLKEWDVSAGILIVQEAGGEVVPIQGMSDYSIIAGTRELNQLIKSFF